MSRDAKGTALDQSGQLQTAFSGSKSPEKSADTSTQLPKLDATSPLETDPFSISSNGIYSVEIQGDLRLGRRVIVKERGEVLFDEGAMGYPAQALWSHGARYLAFNERRGDSGDYLWIFDLQKQKLLKRPDDNLGSMIVTSGITSAREKAGKKWGEGVKDDRCWIKADRWKDESTLTISLSFHFLNTGSGEDSILTETLDVRVTNDGVTLTGASPARPSKEEDIGTRFLNENCGLTFLESKRELVSTFQWAARYGASRETVSIDALNFEKATRGEPHGRGAFEGSIPVRIPLKSGGVINRETWEPTADDFSWSDPPSSSTKTGEALVLNALNKEISTELFRTLLRYRGEKRPVINRPVKPVIYEGNVGSLSARFELEWHQDQRVSGRYWYPNRNPGLRYLLSGSNSVEGRLELVESTDGKKTASLALVKEMDGSKVIWKGKMFNTDGRVLDVTMSRTMDATGAPSDLRTDHVRNESPAIVDVFRTVWQGERLGERECAGLSSWEIRLLRNTVFARHGRTFSSGMLSGFFHRYQGYEPDETYSDGRVTDTDKQNLQVVQSAEASAKRPLPVTPEHALRRLLDALASKDLQGCRSMVHSSLPVTRVVLDPNPTRQILRQKQLSANDKEFADLLLDDGGNGEAYSFIMSALWDLTLWATHDGNGNFVSKQGGMEIGFTNIGGQWWLSRLVETAP